MSLARRLLGLSHPAMGTASSQDACSCICAAPKAHPGARPGLEGAAVWEACHTEAVLRLALGVSSVSQRPQAMAATWGAILGIIRSDSVCFQSQFQNFFWGGPWFTCPSLG